MKFIENLGKSGNYWGWGQTRDWEICVNFPQKFPKSWGGDGEDIFGENRGPIGDRDKLVIGEFWGIFPKSSPKVGVWFVSIAMVTSVTIVCT